MPINFDLSSFAKVSEVFCETGTFHGDGVLYAIESGFKKIASVEISKINQNVAKERINADPRSQGVVLDLILGDSQQGVLNLIDFARKNNAPNPVFWLDAHTHRFENGAVTDGNPCPLLSEIEAINNAFAGQAIILIDDLRIIGAHGLPPRGLERRLKAAYNALFHPDALVNMIKPGWAKSVNLLSVLRLASACNDVSFRLLDGIEPMDVLCVYPGNLHETLFG